jgi:hypothetical protein
VPERTLARWYNKYRKKAEEAEEIPGDAYSSEFYEWIWEHRKGKLRYYVEGAAAELIRERL